MLPVLTFVIRHHENRFRPMGPLGALAGSPEELRALAAQSFSNVVSRLDAPGSGWSSRELWPLWPLCQHTATHSSLPLPRIHTSRDTKGKDVYLMHRHKRYNTPWGNRTSHVCTCPRYLSSTSTPSPCSAKGGNESRAVRPAVRPAGVHLAAHRRLVRARFVS